MSFNYTVRVGKIANPVNALQGFATLIIDDTIAIDGFKIFKKKSNGELFVSAPSVAKKAGEDGEQKWEDSVKFVDLREEGQKDTAMQREIYQFILDEFTKGAPAKAKTAGTSTSTTTTTTKKNPLWGDS